MYERNPHNAPGPFYVVKDECMACGAPEMEAGDLMSHDSTSQCFFVRQPQSADDINAAIRGTLASCCGAVRYGGGDKEILRRFAEIDAASQCDHKLVPSIKPTRRNSARFSYVAPATADETARLTRTLINEIADKLRTGTDFACSDFLYMPDQAAFTYYWGQSLKDHSRYSIRIAIHHEHRDQWLLRVRENPIAERWTAISLDKFFEGHSVVKAVRWYSEDTLFAPNSIGQPHPY